MLYYMLNLRSNICLIYSNLSVLVLENDRFHINEKQDFIMRTAHPAQPAAGVVEVIGAEVEAEAEVGHDHIQDRQDLNQDQDLAQEVRIEVGREVAELWTCVVNDGHLGVEVDPSVLERTLMSIF